MEKIRSCPPADPQPFRPISQTARNRRSSSIGIPVLSSLLSRKTTPLLQESPVMTRLQEKSGGLPESLSQMNPFGLVPSELHVEDDSVPTELAAVKEDRSLPSTSSTAPNSSVSNITPETLTFDGSGATSSTSSMHRNSLSSPSHYSPAPVDLDKPPATLVSPLAANPEQSIAFDLISGDPQSSRPDMPNPPSPGAIPKQRRRMSFDFASLKQSRHSLPPPPSPPQTQRSQTLWRQKKRSAGRERTEFSDRLDGIREPMSERQRALNVKRARKMTQVFGIEPPSALYQITNSDDKNEYEDDDGTLVTLVEDRKQDSLVNILPLSRLSNSSAHRRPISTSSIAAANNSEDGITAGQKPNQSPFVWQIESQPRSTGSPTPSFKARRRRAAKLARFFGVGYHDLSGSTGFPVAASTTPWGEVAESQHNHPDIYTEPPSSMSVDVKMSGPARFWGIMDGRQNMQDATVGDVISKLREMKAK